MRHASWQTGSMLACNRTTRSGCSNCRRKNSRSVPVRLFACITLLTEASFVFSVLSLAKDGRSV